MAGTALSLDTTAVATELLIESSNICEMLRPIVSRWIANESRGDGGHCIHGRNYRLFG